MVRKLKLPMHKVLYVALATMLISCGNSAGDQIRKENAFTSSTEALLSKYHTISFDTLLVFSTDNPESAGFKYKGSPFDSAEMLLLPKSFIDKYPADNGFHACYKFFIDSRHIGLITRSPSAYVASSIKLFVFDTEKDSITNYAELAENWGDAGDFVNKRAWLFKDKNKTWHSFIRVQEGHHNSVENPTDKTTSTWDDYCLLKIAGNSIDTLSKDSNLLAGRFSQLLKQPALP